MMEERRKADQADVASQLKLDVGVVRAEWDSGANYSRLAPGYEKNFAAEILKMRAECGQ
jgi:hypothetical protein